MLLSGCFRNQVSVKRAGAATIGTRLKEDGMSTERPPRMAKTKSSLLRDLEEQERQAKKQKKEQRRQNQEESESNSDETSQAEADVEMEPKSPVTEVLPSLMSIMNPTPTTIDSIKPSETLAQQRSSACLRCHRCHLSCNRARPCRRCIEQGVAEECVDKPIKPKQSPNSTQNSPATPTTKRTKSGGDPEWVYTTPRRDITPPASYISPPPPPHVSTPSPLPEIGIMSPSSMYPITMRTTPLNVNWVQKIPQEDRIYYRPLPGEPVQPPPPEINWTIPRRVMEEERPAVVEERPNKLRIEIDLSDDKCDEPLPPMLDNHNVIQMLKEQVKEEMKYEETKVEPTEVVAEKEDREESGEIDSEGANTDEDIDMIPELKIVTKMGGCEGFVLSELMDKYCICTDEKTFNRCERQNDRWYAQDCLREGDRTVCEPCTKAYRELGEFSCEFDARVRQGSIGSGPQPPLTLGTFAAVHAELKRIEHVQ
ncbi:putative C6 transcription factor [Planoprotostelium fungivorum]|uniref:Putative C6 transcription factor n=1 Tax=Planoprotostelium fungivorum TaxID=1890364 RepID=A0A2P6N0U9_9EUKA|nr:putative C6 transcription factor [Planoprotostelium fungivorum]